MSEKENVCIYVPRDIMVKARETSKATGVPLSRLASEGLLQQVELWAKRQEVK